MGRLEQHDSAPEAEDFNQAMAALKRVTGKEPVGYRSPAAGLLPSTLELLLQRGFLYDSSMMGQDFSPYYCRVGDQAPSDGPLYGAARPIWLNCRSPGASMIFRYMPSSLCEPRRTSSRLSSSGLR